MLMANCHSLHETRFELKFLPVKFPIISFAMQVANYTSDTYLTLENNIYSRKYEGLFYTCVCIIELKTKLTNSLSLKISVV